jgi:hypothetical protein
VQPTDRFYSISLPLTPPTHPPTLRHTHSRGTALFLSHSNTASLHFTACYLSLLNPVEYDAWLLVFIATYAMFTCYLLQVYPFKNTLYVSAHLYVHLFAAVMYAQFDDPYQPSHPPSGHFSYARKKMYWIAKDDLRLLRVQNVRAVWHLYSMKMLMLVTILMTSVFRLSFWAAEYDFRRKSSFDPLIQRSTSGGWVVVWYFLSTGFISTRC